MVAVNFTNDMAERIKAEAQANNQTPSEFVSSLMLRDYQQIDNALIVENLSPEAIKWIRKNATENNMSPSDWLTYFFNDISEFEADCQRLLAEKQKADAKAKPKKTTDNSMTIKATMKYTPRTKIASSKRRQRK